MILNEYKYPTHFDTESEAEEYYKENGMEVKGGYYSDSTYVVTKYSKIEDDLDSSDNNLEKKLKDFLKKYKMSVGEGNVIRSGKSIDSIVKALKKFEKDNKIKIPYEEISQGEETFIKLKNFS